MTETIVENLNQGSKRFFWLERLRGNPVMVKELRSRMRGRRAFILLTVYVLILSLLVGSLYIVYMTTSRNISVNDMQTFGKTVFGVVVWMELLTVSFVTPALTAGSISAERERQTYDLLRVTLLPATSLIAGKFASALFYMLLLLLAAFPLQSLAFLFGGVAPAEFWIATLLLVVTAITFCAAGIFFSSFLNRTLLSTVFAYGFAILIVFGLPMIILLGAAISPVVFQGPGTAPRPAAEALLVIIGWSIAMLTPMATGVITEIGLIDSQNAFTLQVPLSSGSQLTLISPWIPFVVLYLLFSLIFLAQSVRFVRRKDH